ncbi:MAG: glutamate 5-kinase [Candidatus Omnitrophota bacterium]|nr:glutamate 5-kinase [Candidatus Omnitrophota bacterium]
MSEALEAVHRLVVKVGSSVLTDERGRLLSERVGRLVEDVAGWIAGSGHRQAVIVSSGAIACGMAKLGLPRRPTALAQLQACAAIGQSELMHLYTAAFGRCALTTAQILLTQEDLADRARYRNAKQTLLTLLHRRVVPVVNENDTVSVDEITFGDNDRLAALVAATIDAHLLVLLSDVDGLLHNGRPVERVEAAARLPSVSLHERRRHTTKGGMASKLEAARIVGHSGIPMIIANGTRPSVVTQLLAGEPTGTLFVPPRQRLTSRKWWLAFALRHPKGTLIVDEGAGKALSERGKSLLASGVLEVKGRFDAGSCVAVIDQGGTALARGIANFSSGEIARVRGLHSAEAAQRLGQPRAREVIHRDQLVLTRELQ